MPSDRAVLCKLRVWKGKISGMHILQCKFNTEFFRVYIFNILRHKILAGRHCSLKGAALRVCCIKTRIAVCFMHGTLWRRGARGRGQAAGKAAGLYSSPARFAGRGGRGINRFRVGMPLRYQQKF